MKQYSAEFFGTFWLVLGGCGSAVLAAAVPDVGIGWLGVALAFGLTLLTMAYAIGPISGAHLNPAVTLGVYLAGRLPAKDVAPYMVAQVVGGVIAAILLWIIASGSAEGAPTNLAANGWSDYSTAAAFIVELVATFVFVMVILGVTSEKRSTVMAGLVIGLTLTAIHLFSITITGTSLNPARSIGPALFSGGAAIAQLWLFIVAPLLGGAAAGLVYKARMFEAAETGPMKKARA